MADKSRTSGQHPAVGPRPHRPADLPEAQDLRSYYTIPGSSDRPLQARREDDPGAGRGPPDELEQPALVVVGQHPPAVHPRQGHGLGPANQTTSQRATRLRHQAMSRPTSSRRAAPITQPDVYFGENDPGYVVANTKQSELDYQAADGNNVETHYTGTGGVQISRSCKGGLRRSARRLQPADLESGHATTRGSCSSATSRPWPRRRPRS